jgi:hypothetical protein
MINALLFISVCLNILAALIMGVLIGKADRKKNQAPIEKLLEAIGKQIATGLQDKPKF